MVNSNEMFSKSTAKTVSFNDENLILVDETDRVLGYKKKDECHFNQGILHRAFSIFIFNEKNELLLQQRSRSKMLWPGYWSNSCCSHPRQGEEVEEAVQRRLTEELGFTAPVMYLYKFQYQAQFKDIGSENELCSVFAGRYFGPVTYNPSEIEAIRNILPADLTAEIEKDPGLFTPWFKMEWQQITERFLDTI